MKKQIASIPLILSGSILYVFLFWQEKMGFNTLLFSVFYLIALFFLNPQCWQSRNVYITAAGAFLTALLVVWNNSLLARITHIFSFVLLTGFVQYRELRSSWYALVLGLISIVETPLKGAAKVRSYGEVNKTWKSGLRWFRLILIPFGIAAVFFTIYVNANPKFGMLATRFWDFITGLCSFDLSIGKLFFFLMGALLMGGLFWRSSLGDRLAKLDQGYPVQLIREKGKKTIRVLLSMTALKKEYWTAILSLGLLNSLLLMVNITDLRFIWIPYEDATPQMLSQYVHTGTYLLIMAILLAITVLLYFFRNNLHFYPHNELLKLLGHAWILQNGILALSVGIRNFHYINHYGLAYKRLGVILFLVLVVVGLCSLYIKIKKKKTLYYLLLVNGWSLYFGLVAASLINWDVVITKYNIQAELRDKLDLDFLVYGVSAKNIYVLEKHKKAIARKSGISLSEVEYRVGRKRTAFQQRMKRFSWRSWNRADRRNIKNNIY